MLVRNGQELTFHESGMFTINSYIAPTIILFVFLVLFTRLHLNSMEYDGYQNNINLEFCLWLFRNFKLNENRQHFYARILREIFSEIQKNQQSL